MTPAQLAGFIIGKTYMLRGKCIMGERYWIFSEDNGTATPYFDGASGTAIWRINLNDFIQPIKEIIPDTIHTEKCAVKISVRVENTCTVTIELN